MSKRGRTTTVLVGIGWLAVAAAGVTAQEPPRRQGPPGVERGGAGVGAPGVEALLRNRATLGLTEEQVERLRTLRDEHRGEMEPLRERQREAMRELRSEMRELMESRREAMRELRELRSEIREEHRERIRDVLTPEQEELLEGELRQRMRRGPRGPGVRGGGPRGAHRGPAMGRRGPDGRASMGLRSRRGLGSGTAIRPGRGRVLGWYPWLPGESGGIR